MNEWLDGTASAWSTATTDDDGDYDDDNGDEYQSKNIL